MKCMQLQYKQCIDISEDIGVPYLNLAETLLKIPSSKHSGFGVTFLESVGIHLSMMLLNIGALGNYFFRVDRNRRTTSQYNFILVDGIFWFAVCICGFIFYSIMLHMLNRFGCYLQVLIQELQNVIQISLRHHRNNKIMVFRFNIKQFFCQFLKSRLSENQLIFYGPANIYCNLFIIFYFIYL